jgi:O-antigen ligase
VMLAWEVCGCALAVWFYIQAERKHRPRVLLGIGLSLAVSLIVIVMGDALSGGLLMARMTSFLQVDFTYDSLSQQFLRLQIWTGALSIISDNAWLGIGQVNERIAIQQNIGWEHWFRAHQSYLSYLIAGGMPALISGLLMQSPVLALLSAAKRSALFPAFLGLGVVVTLNCLTDSIFQSGVSVQAFMLTTLLFLRASDVDQPTLAPQKQVSSAAT